MEQMTLDIARPQVDYLTQHGLRLMQEPRRFDIRDNHCVTYMRAKDESPTNGHLVWVIGRALTLRALELRNACMNELCGPEVRSRMRFLRELLGEVGCG